ncbi:MAG TPA: alpha/beta hydrolase-fold protein [Sporichthya sp.]|nr:alpha/beta hydrolase-fold protein [Sporichthya sp.]
MALTGRTLLLCLLLLTVAVPVLGARLWSSGRGWTLTLRRVAIIGTAQVAAVALTAAAANDYGAFYPNWHDLYHAIHPAGDNVASESRSFGAPPVPAVQAALGHRMGFGTGSGQVSKGEALRIVEGLHPWGTPDVWPKNGAVVTLMVPGDNGREPQDDLAYVPPSYFSGRPGDARLPIAEIVTGYPGTPSTVATKLDAIEVLRADMAAGTVPPMAFVITRPTEPYPRDTECVDVPNGPQSAHYLAYNVPDYAASTLRLSVPTMGVIGYSTGGYCALKLAMSFPERYLGAASMSGYYAAQPGPSSGDDIFGGDPMAKNEADLIWRLDHLPAPNITVLLATARDEHDPDGFEPAQHFLAHVHSPMSARELIREHGGHNFNTWHDEMPEMVAWMGEQFARSAQPTHIAPREEHEAQPRARQKEATL